MELNATVFNTTALFRIFSLFPIVKTAAGNFIVFVVVLSLGQRFSLSAPQRAVCRAQTIISAYRICAFHLVFYTCLAFTYSYVHTYVSTLSSLVRFVGRRRHRCLVHMNICRLRKSPKSIISNLRLTNIGFFAIETIFFNGIPSQK